MRWMVVVMGLMACAGEDPPNAQRFDAEPAEITEGESVTLTLAATDPQGTEDIVGATLVDADTELVIAELSGPPAEDGSFTTTVSWDDFAALAPLDFEGSDERQIEATFVDAAGQQSGVITATVTLTCPGRGGMGVGDKCFHVETATDAPVTQSCDDVCGAGGFSCATAAAVNAFDEVGTMSFDVDDNGNIVNLTLSIPTCDALGNEQVFQLGGQNVTLDTNSIVDWVCNCRP